MKNYSILIVNSGYPGKSFTLEKLKSLGYYVVVLDSDARCPESLFDERIIVNLRSYDECIEAVKQYLKMPGNHIDGALTFWDEAVLLTAKLTDTFGWIGIPFSSATTAKNKFLFREFCSQQGLPTPKHMTLRTPEDVTTITNTLHYPLVVKPTFGANSAFVIKVNGEKELLAAQKSIKENIHHFSLAAEWENLELYVEEYIPGVEVDIDILLQNGEIKFWSISDNSPTKEPYFIEAGYANPTSISKDKQDELLTMAKDTLAANGIMNGCIHFEAKYSDKGPVPIEINIRMGGDEVFNSIKEAWGINMVEYAAKIAVGEDFSIKKPAKPLSYIYGTFILADKTGVISQVNIHPTIYTKPFIKEFKSLKNVGDRIYTPPLGYDYLGWITVCGKTQKEAEQLLKEGLSYVSYTITPDTNQI